MGRFLEGMQVSGVAVASTNALLLVARRMLDGYYESPATQHAMETQDGLLIVGGLSGVLISSIGKAVVGRPSNNP